MFSSADCKDISAFVGDASGRVYGPYNKGGNKGEENVSVIDYNKACP